MCPLLGTDTRWWTVAGLIYPQRRYMEPVTIKAGPVTGLERADASTVKRAKYVAPKGVDTHGGPH